METAVESYIVDNPMFLKTSEIFAKQSVLSEQDVVDNWLDLVNEIKGDLKIIYSEFDIYLEKAVKELSGDLDTKGLIVRNEYIDNLKRSVAKLISTIEKKPKTNISFKSDKEKIKIFLNDLREISNDVSRRISPNQEVEEILSELSDF